MSLLNSRKDNQAGFTLVELAIVMIIIGLLIGGVFKGRELVNNARVIATISQIKEQKAAYLLFKDTYKAIPGDMHNATEMIPNCAGSCVNGNGNRIIGNPAFSFFFTPANFDGENMQYWRHLSSAGMVSNVVQDPLGIYDFGISSPPASLRGGFHARSHFPVNPAANPYTLYDNTLVLINRADGAVAVYAKGGYVMTPSNAYRIDTKIDDGHAQMGGIQSWSHGWGDGCGNPNFLRQGPNGYDLQSPYKSCEMAIGLE